MTLFSVRDNMISQTEKGVTLMEAKKEKDILQIIDEYRKADDEGKLIIKVTANTVNALAMVGKKVDNKPVA